MKPIKGYRSTETTTTKIYSSMDNIVLCSLSLYVLLAIMFPIMAKANMISSCSQTPHTETCNSLFTSSNVRSALEDSPFKFRNMILQVTTDQAQNIHELASAMDVSSFSKPAKIAWSDCMELLENTFIEINRSISLSSSPTGMEDAQTWLSAAINNIQTCQDGFTELNSSSYLESLPFTFHNISKMIENALAVNNAALLITNGGKDRHHLHSKKIPTWISTADRGFLRKSNVNAHITVAKDGSGDYRTIVDAVAASVKIMKNNNKNNRFIIHVKAGVYKENINIKKSIKNLMLIGDGVDATIVTSNKNVQDGYTTFNSATLGVSGDGFIARGMTFENTAGPEKHQAVALRSSSDRSVFYDCSFRGYQDTLYVHSQRQFYRNCVIYGTVDFIFGNAAAVLQNCDIYARRPMAKQKITVTAQGRAYKDENTGISIQNSRVMAASDLIPVQNSFGAYLGRPWKEYSRTIFMETRLDSLISPAGWLEWNGNFALSTLYYAEYNNFGYGAGTSSRVNWPGYHAITSAAEAEKFTAGDFLSGSSWIPDSGVPFKLGL